VFYAEIEVQIYRSPALKVLTLLTTARANIFTRRILAINHQPLELESCSNPPRIQQVLESKSKKNYRFGFEVFWGERHKFLCDFGHLC